MNLRPLTDSNLIKNALHLVLEERELLSKVLHHLREIDRRRLFSELGYKSLFDFATRKLGYPEDQAYRRIAAMKLLKELPEIEQKIATGQITLTHIGLAHSLFKQEKKIHHKEISHEQKLAVIEQIANKPVREAEKITLALSSSPFLAKPDRVHQISESHIEFKFMAPAEMEKKIDQLKGMLAHKHPSLSLGELFDKLCDLGLSEWNKSKPKTSASRKRCVNLVQHQAVHRSQSQINREVFSIAQNKCKSCGSFYALEKDHITPQAKGGSSRAENLRVLCRSCNQRAAIIEFGQQTMDRYIN